MAQVILGTQFEDEVLKSDVPVLVDFFATWCGPCKMLAPTIDELSGEYDGKVKILKLDVDEANSVARTYGVRSVPTMLFFKNGTVVDTVVGALPKADIVPHIQSMI